MSAPTPHSSTDTRPSNAAPNSPSANAETMPVDEGEIRSALTRANELCDLAEQTCAAASTHALDNPDDIIEARQARDVARHTVEQIRAMARGGRISGNVNLRELLNSTSNTVAHANSEVMEHESGSPEETARRTATHLAEQQAHHPVARALSRIGNQIARPVRHIAASAAGLVHMATGLHAGHLTPAQQHERYVGEGPHRRLRRVHEGFSRSTVSALTFFGVPEATSDEVVASAQTGGMHMTNGMGAMITGDTQAADGAALSVGRGTRNLLRDDLGVLSADHAQEVGHATTVTLQTLGHAATTVSQGVQTVVYAPVALYHWVAGDSPAPAPAPTPAQINAARNAAAANTPLGRQIAGMMGALQHYGAQLDLNHDGHVDLWEACARLRNHGIGAIIDANHDGQINAADVPIMWNGALAARRNHH